jgi:uncharacterized protein (DUF58 family)
MKPGHSLLAVGLAYLALGVAAFFSHPLFFIWIVAGLCLSLLVTLDALVLLFLADTLAVSRAMQTTLALGESASVRLSLSRGRHGFLPPKLRVFDLYPDSMGCSAFPRVIRRRDWAKADSITLDYAILPMQRGAWEFPAVELLFSSLLHFWSRKLVHREQTRGRTYPDFKELLRLAAIDLRGVTERVGMKSIRRRGEGLEFLSLREYQPGDPIRSIDWRATSRRQKYIVREYTEDRDQQVVIIVDSGYRLHRRDGDYLQFDQALNAALLLAYVALKHEDSVALASFGASELWLTPRKGLSALNGMMNQVYDLRSEPVPSSPFAALEKALERLKKRSLIILISNFREEDGESLSWILPRVQKRHLLLLVSMKEAEAEAIAHQPSDTVDAVLEKAAAFSYLSARKQLYRSWERLGLLTLETSARGLSPALINRYLDLKRSGRL